MSKWGFALPTATTVLAIISPDDFTVYDWRVCDELNLGYLLWRVFSDRLWQDYKAFLRSLVDGTRAGFSLRDKDGFLIGRSMRKGIEQDLAG